MTGTRLPGTAAGFDAGADLYDPDGSEFFIPLGAMLVETAGIRPGASVLDAGCGQAAATLWAAKVAGPHGQVTALDASPRMLASGKAAAQREGLDQITWLLGDAENPPLPPGSQDTVLASMVIQFLLDPEQAARNWLALLAPGGTLAVSWAAAPDPAWVPIMAAFDQAVPAPHPGFAQHLRRTPFDSPAALDRFLAGCGYADVTTLVEPITSTYTSPEQWWEAARGQGPYAVSWRHIPADVLERAQAEAFLLLEGMRDGEGLIRRTLQFGITTARRPPAG